MLLTKLVVAPEDASPHEKTPFLFSGCGKLLGTVAGRTEIPASCTAAWVVTWSPPSWDVGTTTGGRVADGWVGGEGPVWGVRVVKVTSECWLLYICWYIE